MIEIISIGRKVKDAISSGLAELNKSLEEVEVEILDNGGLFRKAKVKITVPGSEEIASPVKETKAENGGSAIKEKHEKPMRQERKFEQKREQKKEYREKKERTFEPKVAKEEKPAENVEKFERRERRYEPVTVEVAKKAEDFVTELVAKMGVEATMETSIEDGELHINLTTSSSSLIGYHGEVLDSLEYLTGYVINRESDKFYHVLVNCNGYREKRKESLIALANKMAAKCIKVRHKIVLEPMNSTERKIIHSALSSNDQIITRSEGHEPSRHIVILCKRR